eukprot:scaffold52895_cov14-Tisochrysis_lutea.AAC.1
MKTRGWGQRGPPAPASRLLQAFLMFLGVCNGTSIYGHETAGPRPAGPSLHNTIHTALIRTSAPATYRVQQQFCKHIQKDVFQNYCMPLFCNALKSQQAWKALRVLAAQAQHK